MTAYTKLPRTVVVAEVLECRYKPGLRPVLWSERTAGFELVKTTTGEQIALSSNGGQSSPGIGWELLLKEVASAGSNEVPQAYTWTLYGIQPTASESAAV